MALIGNQLSSAENNSYRVLDNLASFTLTFDGSSSANVLASTDTIALSQHPFVTGQRVTYSSGGGSPIGGLLSGTAYYITKTDQNSFKLASSYVNAITNINIDLVGTGTGVTHSFNVAFDGVNTKFKATYSNGTKCTISRAAQLDIAINGVVQQPYDSNPPPNGFTIEADATIVFSTAPLAGYTFWGKALSGSIASVENSDNSIDNFTGNGSTTNFTLSKTPTNSQNVLVTINGVTQYPSDATGTRSYSTNANVLVFTAPPANGSLIQVRYIGFAGPTSSNVTGFYGRTGNVVLNSSDGIGVGTAKIGTGIVGLATALLVEGNARITGILTIGTSSITLNGSTDTISARAVSTGSTVSIGASTIVVGNNFIGNNSIGLGQTTTTGRNTGINTVAGTLIYNSSNQQIEVYSGTQWIASYVSQFIQAAGGTISDYTSNGVQWRAHIFNSSGTLNVSNAPVLSNTVEYLVVAGGGGGGAGPAVGGGGGGAGGVRLGIGFTVTAGTYSVTVGSGGGQSANGTPSSISNPTSSITATAGGSGGGFFGGLGPPSPSVIGAPGGSGGGGGAYSSASVGPGGNGNVGGALYGLPEGNPGGNGFHNPGSYAAFGGGGGANGSGISYSAPGTPGANASGGRGGDGIPTSISGISSSYGGGGGGGGHPPGGGVGGSGGSGGGGAGSSGPGGTNGTTNTGGGGGGTSHPAANTAGSGGSGIVIVRYQIGQLATKATGGTVSYAGGKTIHTFTSLSSFIVVDPSLTSVDCLVVAGGGGGAGNRGGGGGAGGFRLGTSVPVAPGSYIVTVGSGGAGQNPASDSTAGGSSVFSTITSAGGGRGGGNISPPGSNFAGGNGGSGGGAGSSAAQSGGAGNTPPVSPPQGNSGGSTPPSVSSGGGGGGAGAVGTNANGSVVPGGAGASSSISGSPVTYSAGGAGGNGVDYTGGGGSGTISTGNGGNGGSGNVSGGNGGAGIVIISYPS